jgi:transcriptional regulatory protein RtcR
MAPLESVIGLVAILDHEPGSEPRHLARLLPPDQLDRIDLFDRLQLEQVIEICRTSASLSAAGRRLFAVSRDAKAKPNDADRLRKYLARFGLSWNAIREG